MRKSFSDEELNASDVDPQKLNAYESRVVAVCANKVPEDVVKKGYLTGCVGQRAEMGTYCECTWSKFRDKFAASDFVDPAFAKSDRFLQERPPVVKACSPKYPDASAKSVFMKGCATEPKAEKFCGCSWNEIRKLASAAEIDAGLLPQGWESKMQKACSRLRPQPATPPQAAPK